MASGLLANIFKQSASEPRTVPAITVDRRGFIVLFGTAAFGVTATTVAGLSLMPGKPNALPVGMMREYCVARPDLRGVPWQYIAAARIGDHDYEWPILCDADPRANLRTLCWLRKKAIKGFRRVPAQGEGCVN